MKFDLKAILTPELDYNFLLGKLHDYRDPWGKIGDLLRSGELIRVKKGIYVLGDPSKPYALPILANMIYGPSYVSREFALAFYGLIPERVHLVTSVTPKRHKHFQTPVGEFDYEYQNLGRYAVGFTRLALDDKRGFLIATPEKALADTLWRREAFQSPADLLEYLTEDLRMDLDELRKFRKGLLAEIAKNFGAVNVTLLCQAIKELK